jgi:CRISPR-associated protein Csx16
MTTLFVSRHPGARDWAAEEGVVVDQVIGHLDPDERGGRYLHLSLELPPEWRGRELSAADLRRFGARLEEFRVIPSAADRPRSD